MYLGLAHIVFPFLKKNSIEVLQGLEVGMNNKSTNSSWLMCSGFKRYYVSLGSGMEGSCAIFKVPAYKIWPI